MGDDRRDLSAADFAPLDLAYRRLLARAGQPPGGVLLAQTVGTATARRAALASVPARPGARHLDLGTGFGVMPLELGHLMAIEALGVDTDPAVISDAAAVRDELARWLHDDTVVDFQVGDAAALDLEDASFDLVTARLLFQHLPDPGAVAREIARLLRPGGAVHLFDVDDGLGAIWPPVGDAQLRLDEAYAVTQGRRGGDRMIGRKLPALLSASGLVIDATMPLSGAQYTTSAPRDLGRMSTAGRIAAAADEIVASGALSRDELDALLVAFLEAPAIAQFQVETQLVVVAHRAA